MKPIRERLEDWKNQTGDPAAIRHALRKIDLKHKKMIILSFYRNETPDMICRFLNIPLKPITHFIDAFLAAEQALETALKEIEK